MISGCIADDDLREYLTDSDSENEAEKRPGRVMKESMEKRQILM